VAVFHDDTLDRMCGTEGPVTKYAYASLPPLRLPSDDEWDQGASHGFGGKDGAKTGGKKGGKTGGKKGGAAGGLSDALRIPLLADVFAAVPPETTFIIEFKQDSAELIDRVYKIMVAAGRVEHVVWFSLKDPINRNLAAYCPITRKVFGMGAVKNTVPRIVSTLSVLKCVCVLDMNWTLN
jgi:hypothetical protein